MTLLQTPRPLHPAGAAPRRLHAADNEIWAGTDVSEGARHCWHRSPRGAPACNHTRGRGRGNVREGEGEGERLGFRKLMQENHPRGELPRVHECKRLRCVLRSADDRCPRSVHPSAKSVQWRGKNRAECPTGTSHSTMPNPPS
eukprot:7961943-Alexandrium_andersonii.AAC.2